MLNRFAVALAIAEISAALSPTQAGGVSSTLRPRGESAEVVREGLGFYNFFRSLRNKATTNQHGVNNGAAIAQNGRGNTTLTCFSAEQITRAPSRKMAITIPTAFSSLAVATLRPLCRTATARSVSLCKGIGKRD